MTRVGRLVRDMLRTKAPEPGRNETLDQGTRQAEATGQGSREWEAVARRARQWAAVERGYDSHYEWRADVDEAPRQPEPNALREFFDNRKEGRGIWKWTHYFDLYERHFHRFRGLEVHVLEIGIYSGGSLEMWRDYFGPKARIYGVDIDGRCKAYEDDRIRIFIGDQADRKFWHDFRQNVPALDIVIDDGGHYPEQQIASIEELLPFLRPGGVYCCEDVHGSFNDFASYVHGLGHRLNDFATASEHPDDNDRRIVCGRTPFQSAVASIHLYPFVTVVERAASKSTQFRAPKHGTQWQPVWDATQGDAGAAAGVPPGSPVDAP